MIQYDIVSNYSFQTDLDVKVDWTIEQGSIIELIAQYWTELNGEFEELKTGGNIELLNYWTIELLNFYMATLKYWTIELLNSWVLDWIIELLNYWTSVLKYWTIELLNYWSSIVLFVPPESP